ncbi:hypothetical protein BWQ96_00574 [Gracilariopsis chorda]|uniref:Uncharacterized protein n=1 Tax=Gracilariopsis chorda TaxID=448386 RepID=A0A2V3J5I2_9FLOR|nr:hypothetical protein BWQ96_00574 [Gracilariopsis chorda]|eukprot:PXF49696.1 hypothetical protein BWQ96_00574 [Gracilariopsis chorda]
MALAALQAIASKSVYATAAPVFDDPDPGREQCSSCQATAGDSTVLQAENGNQMVYSVD